MGLTAIVDDGSLAIRARATAPLSVVSARTGIASLSTGLHPGIPFEVYLAREHGVASKSTLDRVRQSPAHYKAWFDGAMGDDDTKALAFGRTFHCALLEPERFAKDFVIEPEFGYLSAHEKSGTTKEQGKANKTRREEWLAQTKGKTCISADDGETIAGMVAKVRAHPLASRLLAEGTPELTVRWQDEQTGIVCKGRADLYVPRVATILDVKTCEDASADAFTRSVSNYSYHRQDAFYRDGFACVGEAVETFLFLACEKTYPYECAIHSLSQEGVMLGYRGIRRAMSTFAECLRTKTWPGYAPGITTLDLPPWTKD